MYNAPCYYHVNTQSTASHMLKSMGVY